MMTLLLGCTNLKVAQQQTRFVVQSPKSRRVALSAIQNWNISGAMSIARQGKVNILSFHWQEKGEHYTIRLSATLNLASLVIIGQPGRVTLVKGRHLYHASTPEALLSTRANIQLPISEFTILDPLPASA